MVMHFSFLLSKQAALAGFLRRPSHPFVMSTYAGVCVSQLHTHVQSVHPLPPTQLNISAFLPF